jgi:hypothetical protein
LERSNQIHKPGLVKRCLAFVADYGGNRFERATRAEKTNSSIEIIARWLFLIEI